MKVINIVRFLPIKGLYSENDITFKIYADLKKRYGVDTLFVHPQRYLPKWATYLKKSIKKRYYIINSKYVDKTYNIKVFFFQSFFPRPYFRHHEKSQFFNFIFHFSFFKKKIYQVVVDYKPSIVHAHTIQDAYYAYKISKKYNIPYIITIRGLYTDIYELKIVKKILRSAKIIITPSYSLKNKLDSHYKIDLLPHGLDKEWYTKDKKEFSEEVLRLITVSRFLEWKNIHIVLESLAVLKNKGIKFTYDHIGDGPLRLELESLVTKLNLNNMVTFHGLKTPNEIRQIFKNTDVFIMLSYRETFGRVYFEAAAQGLLIIGSKGTGADGYMNNEDAFFIEPNIISTVEVLEKINKEVFYTKTMNSKNKMDSFKNNKIIDQYYNLIDNNCLINWNDS